MDNVETMAYVGEVPWHKKGNEMKRGATPKEMMVAGECDWKVNKLPFTFSGGKKSEKYFLLVRDKDNMELSPCGPRYVPVQNETVMNFFTKFAQAGKMTMETVGSLDNGRHIFALAKMNKSFSLPGKDAIEDYLLISHPHIWGKALTIMYTPVRVVCHNTLTMALGQNVEKFRHAHVQEFSLDVQKEAELTLGLYQQEAQAFKAKAELLANKRYGENEMNKYLCILFQPNLINPKQPKIDITQFSRTVERIRELISTQPGAKLSEGTWWTVLNAITYYCDWEAGRSQDTRLFSTWYGVNAGKKRRALDLAVEMAK